MIRGVRKGNGAFLVPSLSGTDWPWPQVCSTRRDSHIFQLGVKNLAPPHPHQKKKKKKKKNQPANIHIQSEQSTLYVGLYP